MKKVLFIVFTALLFVGCKKENRIERNLWKSGGEWNIETWQESQTSSHYQQDNYSETYLNAGTMRFNKDGTGSMTFQEGSSAYTDAFTYTNTETQLTIFDLEGEGVVFELDWKRNDLTLSLNESETYSSYDENFNPIIVHSTYSLKIDCKKK
ncbi:MAG TPA: hypothetical protein VFD77_09285 [Brumimicrobium sp.]|nr:hypothetical protein [Brumimicrobium sp.]